MPGQGLQIKFFRPLPLSQVFITLGQQVYDSEVIRRLPMGFFQLLQGQLGPPRQPEKAGIALQPGQFSGNRTHVTPEGLRRSGPGMRRAAAGEPNKQCRQTR